MKCQYCNEEFNKNGLKKHENSCIKTIHLKNDIIKYYVEYQYSICELREKFKLCKDKILKYLDGYIRTISEANKIAHKKYPEKFKHSEETKDKMREKRLEFMKNNSNKTAWRLANKMSYPEQLFYNKLIELEYDKKYLIIREKSIFPYFIDFAFEDYKLAIEIDGSQHLLLDRKEKDNKKDDLLISLNWSVIRFSVDEIKTNLNNCFKIIEEKLNNLNKIEVIKVGIIRENKKYIKKERNENGFTEEQIKKRKIKDRPNLKQLINDVKELGYAGTGRKYNVSRETIKRWLKQYLKMNNINLIINEKDLTFNKHSSQLNKIKIEDRPSFEILFNEVNTSGYTLTSIKYNVSRKTIYNWFLYYKNNFNEYSNINISFKNNKYTEKQKLTHYNNRKIKDRPSFEELLELLNKHTYKELSIIYNVNIKTIYNWKVYYNKINLQK